MADYNSIHSGATIDTTITNADAGNIGKNDSADYVGDLNSLTKNGFYTAASSATNRPAQAGSNAGLVIVNTNATIFSGQFFVTWADNKIYHRTNTSGTWSSWQEIHHSGNMQTTTANGIGVVKLMKNTSGGAIADAASVAGSTISSVKFDNTGALTVIAVASGTWKSVNGASLASNETGYFVRTA